MSEQREKTKYEKMMDKVAHIFVENGYVDMGYQQTLSDVITRMFVGEEREIIYVTSEQVDEEVWDDIMGKKEE